MKQGDFDKPLHRVRSRRPIRAEDINQTVDYINRNMRERKIAQRRPISRVGLMEMVNVTEDGGSAGDQSTQCSFTYTVTDIYGNQLATGATPNKQRPSIGKMVSGDGLVGSGYFTGAGAFVLHDANEVPSPTTDCA